MGEGKPAQNDSRRLQLFTATFLAESKPGREVSFRFETGTSAATAEGWLAELRATEKTGRTVLFVAPVFKSMFGQVFTDLQGSEVDIRAHVIYVLVTESGSPEGELVTNKAPVIVSDAKFVGVLLDFNRRALQYVWRRRK